MVLRKILITLTAGLVCLSVGAQGVRNVRINEVLIVNETNAVDDYGEHNAWIELFNAGYENANVGGCYLKVRYVNPQNPADSVKTYTIPRGDGATLMSPQSYLLFYSEGTDTKGTFYTNFTLQEGQVASIELLESNGKDVIDTFEFPEKYVPTADVSWGWEGDSATDELTFGELGRTTPNATNDMTALIAKDELFRQRDPSGGIMAIIAMSVVMLALVMIALVMKGQARILTRREEKKGAPKEAKAKFETKSTAQATKGTADGEIMAAIATAIALSLAERHIDEPGFITINNTSRQNRR